jgi:glycosyltransferase involved in cell wall biosynthesis
LKIHNIIIFSTADWDNPFWTNKQHTADRLAKRGNKVFYIESLGLRSPTLKTQDLNRVLKRIFSFVKGARKVRKNLWVYSPMVIPLHRFAVIRLVNKILLSVILKYYKWKLGLESPICWTYNPMVLNYMESLKPSRLVYHSVDDLSAAPGINKKMILSAEKSLLRKMDYVFCTSLKIYDHCNKDAKGKTYYFSNVVDYEHFSKARSKLNKPKELEVVPTPILGFVGAVSEYKLDIDLICEIAQSRPQWHWVLVGKVGEGQPGTKVDNLYKYKNIHLLGPRNYDDLPNYLAHFDVCIIPAPLNDYTHSMFPMKFYEFMAAGKPIVASKIDSLKEVSEIHYSYQSQVDFLKCVESALNRGIKNPEKCDKYAKENTWEKRLDKMLELLS